MNTGLDGGHKPQVGSDVPATGSKGQLLTQSLFQTIQQQPFICQPSAASLSPQLEASIPTGGGPQRTMKRGSCLHGIWHVGGSNRSRTSTLCWTSILWDTRTGGEFSCPRQFRFRSRSDGRLLVPCFLLVVVSQSRN